MKYKFIFIIVLGLIFFGCKKEEAKPKSSFQEVYEMSEMALLMEDMYKELKEIRPEVISGNEIGQFPEKFNQIHSAKMTSSFERTVEFEKFTELLLHNFNQLYKSKSDSSKVELYNNTIKTCVSCHKSDAGCMGPVSRIEKLLIQK